MDQMYRHQHKADESQSDIQVEYKTDKSYYFDVSEDAQGRTHDRYVSHREIKSQYL